jgi:hypothetical protein
VSDFQNFAVLEERPVKKERDACTLQEEEGEREGRKREKAKTGERVS